MHQDCQVETQRSTRPIVQLGTSRERTLRETGSVHDFFGSVLLYCNFLTVVVFDKTIANLWSVQVLLIKNSRRSTQVCSAFWSRTFRKSGWGKQTINHDNMVDALQKNTYVHTFRHTDTHAQTENDRNTDIKTQTYMYTDIQTGIRTSIHACVHACCMHMLIPSSIVLSTPTPSTPDAMLSQIEALILLFAS